MVQLGSTGSSVIACLLATYIDSVSAMYLTRFRGHGVEYYMK